MQDFNNASEILIESLLSFWRGIAMMLPKLATALVVLLIGWFVARLLARLILKILQQIKFDILGEKLNVTEFIERASLATTPSGMVSKLIYYLLMLFVIITVSNMMGWTRVSEEIYKLMGFLPKLFLAIVFFLLGTYIAQFIRNIITGATATLGLSTGKVIGNVVFYFLFIIVVITSLNQAGMDTTMISSNVLLIIGTVLLAMAVSYGVASIDLVRNILAGFFTRKTYMVGQQIEIDGERGKIMDINNVSLTLEKENGEKVLIPTHMLIKNKVRIFN